MNSVGPTVIPLGATGASGFVGASGVSGHSGWSGLSGYSGFSGISGYSGYSGVVAPSGPALVQQKVATGSGDVVGAGFTAGLTAGNSVIIVLTHLSTEATTAVNIDATPLTLAVSITVAGVTTEIWYIHNIGSGLSSFNVDTDNEQRISANASEWSGLTNAAPEATNTNSGLAGSTVTTNSVTPSSTRSLVIAAGGWTANNYSTGPTDSFTRLTPTGGGAAYQEAAYNTYTSAAARSTGWGLTAPINWSAAICAFGAP